MGLPLGAQTRVEKTECNRMNVCIPAKINMLKLYPPPKMMVLRGEDLGEMLKP